jgi:hypothetical protein
MKSENSNNTKQESRKEDLGFLIENIEKIHPDPYKNINQKKETFEKSLEKSLDVDKEYLPLAIQESLSLLKDAHTNVQSFRKEFLPFVFKTINEKTYIVATSSKTKEHLYKQIQKINGYSLEQIFERISALSSKENPEVLLKDLDFFLESNKILKYYGFSNSKKADFTTSTGDFSVEFKGDEDTYLNNPLDWKGKDFEFVGNKIYRFREQGENLIFQYNSCENTGFSDDSLKRFKEKLDEKTKKSKNIIVDLRLNSGGDTEIMRDFFENIPKEKNIYVASSRRTFSSAMHHLIYLKRCKGAKIIGENAGQKANRFGYGKDFKLPNSKINISCSRTYFELYPEKDLEIIEPDIKIPITIEDYINNTDPLNKWVKENLK